MSNLKILLILVLCEPILDAFQSHSPQWEAESHGTWSRQRHYSKLGPPQCLLLYFALQSAADLWQFGSVMAFGCRAQIRVMMGSLLRANFTVLRAL